MFLGILFQKNSFPNQLYKTYVLKIKGIFLYDLYKDKYFISFFGELADNLGFFCVWFFCCFCAFAQYAIFWKILPFDIVSICSEKYILDYYDGICLILLKRATFLLYLKKHLQI
jgi:hypothetical protein